MNVAAAYDSDHEFSVQVTDANGLAVTDATVELTVLNSAGREVSGASWPLVMVHGADGTYAVDVPAAVVAERVRDSLTYEVVATRDAKKRTARIPVSVAPDTD